MSTLVKIIVGVIIAAALAFALAATASFHSPGLAGQMQCPQGSTIQVTTNTPSLLQLNKIGLSIECKDSQGNLVDSSETATQGFWKLTAIYFLACFVLVLLATWVFSRLSQRRSPGIYR